MKSALLFAGMSESHANNKKVAIEATFYVFLLNERYHYEITKTLKNGISKFNIQTPDGKLCSNYTGNRI